MIEEWNNVKQLHRRNDEGRRHQDQWPPRWRVYYTLRRLPPEKSGGRGGRVPDEQILARRITLDEFINWMGKLEYIDGRMVTGSGVELFVGVKEFPEPIRALEEEKAALAEADACDPADRV